MIRTLNGLGLESEISDFIARSESAKNDFFSKSRLLPLYEKSNLNKKNSKGAFCTKKAFCTNIALQTNKTDTSQELRTWWKGLPC